MANMMSKTSVVIMGISIPVRYTIHDPAYVEWTIDAWELHQNPDSNYPHHEMNLLQILLRVHYSDLIESVCRETTYYNNYAAAASVADDWADSLRYTKQGLKGLFNEEEDIPF